MAIDGIILAAVKEEMQQLLGCRITKIYQPGKRDIVVHCRRPGSGWAVVLSADPQNPRVFLAEDVPVNPPSPPSFCMLLRKYLEGGKILKVEQPDLERILEVTVENTGCGGEPAHYRLIAETMGRHSNIILLDAAGQVLDAVVRIDSLVNRHREIVPGAIYIPPPDQVKLSLLALDWPSFLDRMAPASPKALLSTLIRDSFTGIGPRTAEELVQRAGFDLDAVRQDVGQDGLKGLYLALEQLADRIKERRFAPRVLLDARGEPCGVSAFQPASPSAAAWEFTSISRALETYYASKLARQETANLRRNLIQVVEKHQGRLAKKLKAQAAELAAAEDADTYRIYGELLTASLYQLKRGMQSVTVENFYDPDLKRVTIPLDHRLTPSENAQAYFRRYTKAKKTLAEGAYHYQRSLDEQEYLEQVRTSLELAADAADLSEIQRELIEEGYIRPTRSLKEKRPKDSKSTRPQPFRFRSSDGLEILVGRNNRQNEYVTFRAGSPNDIWLHVKDMAGSHVIIKTQGTELPPATLEEAALLAAYYSKGRTGRNVAVDYTFRKHVRKPRGAKPGMVIYDHQRTLFVSPLAEVIKPLLARQTEAASGGGR
ncbi:MAG: fibronectin-binding domain-containing protein [Firmicutes bacterium]|nr:fibronectin-binding domain-containing protein [Bacillota bacterium]